MNTKQFVTVEAKALEPSDEFPNGGWEAVLSTDALDRDGEILDYGCFNPLPATLPALKDHTAKIDSLVGRGVPSYVPSAGMVFRGGFDEDAASQLVRAKLKSGSLNAMSIGFGNARREVRDGVVHVTKAEALEGSFVVIPANPEALVIAAKQYGSIEPPAGSYEEVQEDVLEALYGYYGADAWVCLIATFADRVVYSVTHYPAQTQDGTYQASYGRTATDTDGDNDGDVVIEGAPEAVEINQVVSPKALAHFARKAGRRNSVADQEALNAAHDALVTAGADCPTPGDDMADKTTGTNTAKAETAEVLEVLAAADELDAALETLEIEAELDDFDIDGTEGDDA